MRIRLRIRLNPSVRRIIRKNKNRSRIAKIRRMKRMRKMEAVLSCDCYRL